MKGKVSIAFLVTGLLFLAGCKTSTHTPDEVINQTKNTEVTEEILSPHVTNEEEDEERISDRTTYAGEAHLWEEISIIIPDVWADKYIIKDEANGFSVFQKASAEKVENMGFLCGVYKSNQYTPRGAGETLAAYTDDGMMYYVMMPTDMNCYMEDEVIAKEYIEMMEMVPWIAGSLQITADNVHYDATQYVIPISSILNLNEHQLVNFNDNQLWIARNEIYARHGKVFQNEYLNSYFNTCSWYQPIEGKTEVGERELNEVELANLKRITEAEASYATSHVYPKQYPAKEEVVIELEGAMTKCVVMYEAAIDSCILTIDGTQHDISEYVTTPFTDLFYVTDIASHIDGLEIAVLDDGDSADSTTHFFTYDGDLHYIGAVEGFPFREQNSEGLNGFTIPNCIIGTGRVDLIETAYVEAFYRYNSEKNAIEMMNNGLSNYKWYNAHELYVSIPVYVSNDENAPMVMMAAQKEVFFLKTDGKEWIFVRGSDGTEGYIQVKDGKILNVGLPAEEVFSDLYFFG